MHTCVLPLALNANFQGKDLTPYAEMFRCRAMLGDNGVNIKNEPFRSCEMHWKSPGAFACNRGIFVSWPPLPATVQAGRYPFGYCMALKYVVTQLSTLSFPVTTGSNASQAVPSPSKKPPPLRTQVGFALYRSVDS